MSDVAREEGGALDHREVPGLEQLLHQDVGRPPRQDLCLARKPKGNEALTVSMRSLRSAAAGAGEL